MIAWWLGQLRPWVPAGWIVALAVLLHPLAKAVTVWLLMKVWPPTLTFQVPTGTVMRAGGATAAGVPREPDTLELLQRSMLRIFKKFEQDGALFGGDPDAFMAKILGGGEDTLNAEAEALLDRVVAHLSGKSYKNTDDEELLKAVTAFLGTLDRG